MWILSAVFLGFSYLVSFRKLRARTFYVILSANRVPALIALLAAGAEILGKQLAPLSVSLLGIGLMFGLICLPWSIIARRKWFRIAKENGHLQRSLERDAAEWDPTHDMDKTLQDERISRPGYLLRLLPWIGPAIGLALADVAGQATAVVVIGVLTLAFGSAGLYAQTVIAVAYSMDFGELNRHVGRPIYIVT